MNTEITLKGIPVLRSGYSDSGFASARMVLAINHNSSNKTINVKYMGCHIGYISHIHCGDLPDGGVELRGDISFPISNLIAHREILNNKDVYPTCIIETASGANEARLSEVILFTEEEFKDQQPLDLSDLLDLVNNIAKSEAPAKPQGDGPYIYAPGMDNDDIVNWLNSIVSELNIVDARKGRIKSLEESCKELKGELGEIETFLSKTIHA
ncbi:hypothetical protein HZ480_001841 [Salmonella enterica]|nr:hypothetical protein [Salmonella enterica]ECW2126286.1 hypothetical protein [Salmonella enterica]EFQ6723094.1 hypothetical protein [Salmonella enterica]EFR2615343.1 hypothetical protein [Salmonella enterica]EHJ0802557.1 hypothetical protein [Salmonella enterica]